MKIARVLTRMNVGGPAHQILASDPILASRGHQVRLFTGTPSPGEGDLFERARERGLDVVRVPGLAPGWSPRGCLRARAWLRGALAELAPDVVHTHTAVAGWVGRRALPRDGGPARLHTFHGHVLEGYFPPAISRGLTALERRLARGTDRIVAVSHATADDLLRLKVVSEEKLVVVPPGVDLEPFLAVEGQSGALRGPLGLDARVFLVGVVGRLTEVKRPEVALEVLSLLAPRHPRLHLVFVGDGDGRAALDDAVAGLADDVRARVHRVGARDDVPAVLADLDAVLLTSRTEGLPVALIEAAAAARPAVAARVGGVPELVVEERTGFLGDSADELAFGLDQILQQPALGPALGARARVRVRDRHGARALADRLERLYETVVEERRCAC